MLYHDEHYGQAIIETCRWMHQRGYISGTEGNVSIRISKRLIMMTPSGKNKGFLKPDDLVVLNESGNQIKGRQKPTSEYRLHLQVYKMRDDVNAVIHAHPKAAIAATIAGVSLAKCILPETILSFGSIPTADYATPTTEDVPLVLSRYIPVYNAIMMDRHGSLTLGSTIEEAYNRLESLEHTAEITLTARLLGPLKSLPATEVGRLMKMAKDMGINADFSGCSGCSVCDRKSIADGRNEEDMINAIVETVMDKLKKDR
jgi:L-fuculose-phosphate aldolase